MTDCSQTGGPLSFGKIRAPLLPVLGAMTIFLQPLLLRRQELVVVEYYHGCSKKPETALSQSIN